MLVVDKPAGLVVHPGAGNPRHTLQNALLGWDPKLAALPRAGIIHRLDKDTSGLLMVARTPEAHTALTRAAHGAVGVPRVSRGLRRGHDRRAGPSMSRSAAIAAIGCAWRCAATAGLP